mmetsp:Transcript_10277/g.28685  ORF Transcript_10277/g.28685 Transcript_10277/m.28685 type:complete len:320 (+) Transcript_10277:493-1452(+)
MSDNEPFSRRPRVQAFLLRIIKTAPHANNWLIVFAHGQLLQKIIGLEQHLAHAGARQPRGLEPFHLHVFLRCTGERIEREERLLPHLQPHLQCQRQVLQIHCTCRIKRRANLQCTSVVEGEAAHASRNESATEALRGTDASGNALHLPPNVELCPPFLLELVVLFLPDLLFFCKFPKHYLCHALAVHDLVPVRSVGFLSDGQRTMPAEQALARLGFHWRAHILGDLRRRLLGLPLETLPIERWLTSLLQSELLAIPPENLTRCVRLHVHFGQEFFAVKTRAHPPSGRPLAINHLVMEAPFFKLDGSYMRTRGQPFVLLG